jgi:hypothetical protein
MTGPTGRRGQPLRDDALKPHPAGVAEHGGAGARAEGAGLEAVGHVNRFTSVTK